MKTKLPKLSNEQWNFLSVLHVFGKPVSIEIAGTISPIPPGQFLELLGLDKPTCYIIKTEDGNYKIHPKWFPILDNHLQKINTQEKINDIVDRLYSNQLIDQLGFPVIKNLISKINPFNLSPEIEINLAQMAIEKKDERSAFNFLKLAVMRLLPVAETPEYCQYFLRSVTMLVPLWFFSEGNFKEMISYIKKALKISNKIGDKRSYTILLLHLSSYYQFIGKEEDSWDAFSKGYQGVKDLGDNDILNQTASLITMNLIFQGLYKEAQPHFEGILSSITIGETDGMPPYKNIKNIFFYGSCLIFLGEFVEAIGFLTFCWKKAKEESDRHGSLFAQNIIAVTLLILKHIEPAKTIIQGALKEAKRTEYAFVRYLLRFNLSYAYFLEQRFEKAAEMIEKTSAIGEELGTIRFPMAGYILEMLFELDRRGYHLDPRFSYKDQFQQIMNGKNIDLKGTALRLKAQAIKSKEVNLNRLEECLISSEKYLIQSGNRIQLGKTYLELACLNLKMKKADKAASYHEKADQCFGEYAAIFSSEDSKQFTKLKKKSASEEEIYQQRFDKILEAYDAITTSSGKKDIFFKSLKSICKIAGAERAGLFRFEKNTRTWKIHDTFLYNIIQKEIKSKAFESGNAVIMNALKKQKICMERNDPETRGRHLFSVQSRCALPIYINDDQWWVLYMDNIFIRNFYDDMDVLWITKLVRKAVTLFQQSSDNHRNMALTEWVNQRDSIEKNKSSDDLKTENPAMLALISKADKIAATESTVLITGETGTGKELLARRIHSQSPRKMKPFVVVDLTAIPENLLESELFGHEKGAFTGADRQKIGRLEQAHQGTLFLDEIGEIPLSFQVKLLRLLQEKKITRVGGAKTIPIDFRLIAATNRNLESEVAAGNFRQDLYYRLHVVPISLPPLRERLNDIIVLAKYFLSIFKKQHNKANIRLTQEDEKWLLAYHWPGNIRELKNIIERNVILSTNDLLNLSLIPFPSMGTQQLFQNRELESTNANGFFIPVDDLPTLDEVQRRYIKLVLEKTNGKITGPGGAVNIIGMKSSSLYNRMKKLGIR